MRQKTIIKIKLAAAFLLLTATTYAVVPRTWDKHYGGLRYNYGPLDCDVVILSSGNSIVASDADGAVPPLFNGDITVSKFDINGNPLGSYSSDFFGANNPERTKRIIVKEPYIYIMGTASADIFLIKLDTSLSFQWAKSFNGAGSANDDGIDMGIDNSGNVYIAGSTVRAASGTDIVLLKYSPAGGVLFTKYNTSAGSATDVPVGIKVNTNGTFYVAATKTSATYGTRMAAMKYASNGVKIWENFHDAKMSTTNSDEATALSFDPATDEVYITGRGQFDSGDFDWTVAKFDGSTGAKLWSKRYAGASASQDRGADIAFFNSGALYLCGSLNNTISGITNRNMVTKKLDPANGNLLWSKNFAGPTNDNDDANSLLVTPNESIYVIGHSERNMLGTQGYFITLKYNSSGVNQWKDSLYYILNGGCNVHDTFGKKGVYNATLQSLIVLGYYQECTTAYHSQVVLVRYAPTSSPKEAAEENNRDAFNNNVNIYPNPVTADFTITNDEEISSVTVTDLTGRIVYLSKPAERMVRVNSSNWSRGIYSVEIYIGNQKAYRKLIKN